MDDGAGTPARELYYYGDQSVGAADPLRVTGGRACLPGVGVFVQPDSLVTSLANPQTLSRYVYALGNPVNYVDPTEHATAPPGPPLPTTIRDEFPAVPRGPIIDVPIEHPVSNTAIFLGTGAEGTAPIIDFEPTRRSPLGGTIRDDFGDRQRGPTISAAGTVPGHRVQGGEGARRSEERLRWTKKGGFASRGGICSTSQLTTKDAPGSIFAITGRGDTSSTSTRTETLPTSYGAKRSSRAMSPRPRTTSSAWIWARTHQGVAVNTVSRRDASTSSNGAHPMDASSTRAERPPPLYVEFRVHDPSRLAGLCRIVDAIAEAKEREQFPEPEAWKELVDEQTLVWFVQPGTGGAAGAGGDSPGASSGVGGSGRWPFRNVFETLGHVEYVPVACRLITEGVGRIEFEPWAFPYGGTGSLHALIRSFGFELIGENAGFGFEPLT